VPPGYLPVPGKITLGVAMGEMEVIVIGWSAKNLLGKTIYNGKKTGKIDVVIMTPLSDVKVPFFFICDY
jgi:hypothetical protein